MAAGATPGQNVRATAQGERPLTNEPLYQGEPILAIAAVDELTAAEAIEKFTLNTRRCRLPSTRSTASDRAD